jgi:hypothetical protein
MTDAGREVLFELRQIGNSVKVTAIDVATNTEVSTVGPASAGAHGLKMAALRKLNYVLAERARGVGHGPR